jgi:hypothetical protein
MNTMQTAQKTPQCPCAFKEDDVFNFGFYTAADRINCLFTRWLVRPTDLVFASSHVSRGRQHSEMTCFSSVGQYF